MRALVLRGERDVRVETVDDPRPQSVDGAVVKVTHTGICGSDLHLYHGDQGTPPVRLGHEAVGEVVETGSGVQRFDVGDRVLVSGVVGCGRCRACLVGDVVRCDAGMPKVFGVGPELHGGQAEAVAVPMADHALLKIPDAVSPEQAMLLTDILPTGWFGAEQAGVRPGDTVAVIGLGPVGIQALISAQVMGASRVLAVDPIQDRLDRAAELGAIPIDASSGTGVAGVLAATAGKGVDCAIEAVGLQQTIHDAIFCTRAGGTVSVVGVNLQMDFPFPMALAFIRDLTFRIGLCPVPRTWDRLLPLVASGRLHPEVVITHRMPLSEGPKAYEMFDGRDPGVLKIVLDPTA